MSKRQESARRAADRLEAARSSLATLRVFAGFDGAIDSIIRMASRRWAPGREGFEPISGMGEVARRIEAAAGRSANFEMVVQRVKEGGNSVLFAQAAASLGANVDFAGIIGAGDHVGPSRGEADVHAVFRPFAAHCKRVWLLGAPMATDAIEFDDGKLMLGRTEPLERATWATIVEAFGGEGALIDALAGAGAIATSNWTMTLGMPDIWRGLIERVAPKLGAPEDGRTRWLFVDLADPAKRSDEELGGALEQLTQLEAAGFGVALGMNLAESERIGGLLGAAHGIRTPEEATPDKAAEASERIRAALDVRSAIIHHHRGSGASVSAADGAAQAGFVGPYTRNPELSTGAGDHFNAGMTLALCLGLDVLEAQAVANGVSGLYVRRGVSPTLDQALRFMRDMPEPE